MLFLLLYMLSYNQNCSTFDMLCDYTMRLCGCLNQFVVSLTFPCISFRFFLKQEPKRIVKLFAQLLNLLT